MSKMREKIKTVVSLQVSCGRLLSRIQYGWVTTDVTVIHNILHWCTNADNIIWNQSDFKGDTLLMANWMSITGSYKLCHATIPLVITLWLYVSLSR